MVIRMWSGTATKQVHAKSSAAYKSLMNPICISKRHLNTKKEQTLKCFTQSEEMWQQLWNMFIYLKSKLGIVNKLRFWFTVSLLFALEKNGFTMSFTVTHLH